MFFTGTGSLVYEIKTNDVYEYFYKVTDLFDFSDYPQGSNFFDLVNKKFIGKMKDEFKGKIISEFGGLKSKMYSLTDVLMQLMEKTKKQKESTKRL